MFPEGIFYNTLPLQEPDICLPPAELSNPQIDSKEKACNYANFSGILPADAQVVLVLGPTGCGKTSFLEACTSPEARNIDISWREELAIISHFGDDPQEGQKWLGCCGLNSIPTWCKPFHALSTGIFFLFFACMYLYKYNVYTVIVF
jgi:hypothetical protein